MPPPAAPAPNTPRWGARWWVAAVLGVVPLLASAWVLINRVQVDPEPVTLPWEFVADEWVAVMPTEGGFTTADLTRVNTLTPTGMTPEDAAELRTLGQRTAVGVLTAAVPLDASLSEGLPSGTGGRCEQVNVLATAPAALPVNGADGDWAKILVLADGICRADPRVRMDGTPTAPITWYVYAHRAHEDSASTAGWEPVWEWQVPVPASVTSPPTPLVPDTELTALTGCAEPGVRARIAVAAAYEQMCAEATKAGMGLTAVSAYRTPAQQKDLFDRAVTAYGSEDKARQRVAYSDGDTCWSRACDGISVGVKVTKAVSDFLSTPAVCAAAGTTTPAVDGTCADGATVVSVAEVYGFAQPAESVPGYLEYAMATTDEKTYDRCDPTTRPVPFQIADVFRCRLSQAGVSPEVAGDVAAQAVTIARCESGWNPAAQAFAGRYTTEPHPTTGRIYTHRGLFMLQTDTETGPWLPGGVSGWLDPIAASHAAASLWLATGGWDWSGCATGAGGAGFESESPILGGGVPDWFYMY